MLLAIHQLQSSPGQEFGLSQHVALTCSRNSPECMDSMKLSPTLRPCRKTPGLMFAQWGFSHEVYLMESS